MWVHFGPPPLQSINQRPLPHQLAPSVAPKAAGTMRRFVALASLALLSARASAQNCTMDRPGVALGSGAIGSKKGVASASACCAACDAEPGCVAFTYEPAGGSSGVCYMKDNVVVGKCSKPTCISGTNGKKPHPLPSPPGPHPPHHHPPAPGPPVPPAPPAAEQLKDLATLRSRFFDFYLDFGVSSRRTPTHRTPHRNLMSELSTIFRISFLFGGVL